MMRRTALFLAASALALIGIAPTAAAGGPTGVTLINRDQERATFLGYENRKYAELESLVRSTSPARECLGQNTPDDRAVVQVTWLRHDITPWRIDWIHPSLPDGPMICTQEINHATGEWASSAWRKADQPERLVKFLRDLGMLGGTEPAQAVQTTAAAPDVTAAPSTAPAGVVPVAGAAMPAWGWSVPAFLLGAVLAVIALRMWSRRDPEPRVQLVDVE